MNFSYHIPSQLFQPKPAAISKINNQKSPPKLKIVSARKKCLRCKTLYQDKDNSPTACCFHGYATGEKGLFTFAPPHQGIDGEWSDKSGVIVYKWNEKDNRPNTGRRDGAVVPSMMRTPRLANEGGMCRMMMVSPSIDHLFIL